LTPQQIIDGLTARNRELTAKNDELSRLTEKAAQAKRDYQIAKARKMLDMKMEGTSVTLIPETVKGDKTVADLQYAWDVAEGVLLACRERIKDLRTQIDTYRSVLTWLRAEMLRTE